MDFNVGTLRPIIRIRGRVHAGCHWLFRTGVGFVLDRLHVFIFRDYWISGVGTGYWSSWALVDCVHILDNCTAHRESSECGILNLHETHAIANIDQGIQRVEEILEFTISERKFLRSGGSSFLIGEFNEVSRERSDAVIQRLGTRGGTVACVRSSICDCFCNCVQATERLVGCQTSGVPRTEGVEAIEYNVWNM